MGKRRQAKNKKKNGRKKFLGYFPSQSPQEKYNCLILTWHQKLAIKSIRRHAEDIVQWKSPEFNF